jgi:membrane fusion protein, heavy metal efflux system
MKVMSVWVLVLLGLSACRGGDEQSATEPAKTATPPAAEEKHDENVVHVEAGMLRDLQITTRPVESRTGGEEVSLLGELAVDERRYAEVGVPVPSRVTRLLASPGDTVRVGQPLVELQSTELGRARADYQTAQARVHLAERALLRKRDLAAERIAPQREVQEAEAAAAEARAGLRAAEAFLSAIGVPLPTGESGGADSSRFVLRSPVAGVVIERAVVSGEMLEPSKPAFRVGDLSTLWLTVHAFERDAVRIRPGAPARIAFSALPGRDFQGSVALLGREVAKESRTVPVRIDVRNTGGALRPGMSATAMVPVGASDTPLLTVPVAAVQRVREQWCVFIPKDTGVFEIRRIGRGRDLGGEVEVLSGLKPGETVVVDGAFLLKSQAEKAESGHGGHGGLP